MKKIIAIFMMVCFLMSFASIADAACSKCSKCTNASACTKNLKTPINTTACSKCIKAPANASNCSKCLKTPVCKKCNTCENSTAETLKIVNLNVTTSGNTSPCKISISGLVEGNVSKITYSILNSQGKTVAKCNAKCNKNLKTHTCGCGGYIYTPGVYSIKLTAYGDGKPVSVISEDKITVVPATVKACNAAVKSCKTNTCQKKTCAK